MNDMERITFNFLESEVVRAASSQVEDEESLACQATLPEIRREADRHGMSLQQYILFLDLQHLKA